MVGWIGAPSWKSWPWGLGRIYPFVSFPGLTIPSSPYPHPLLQTKPELLSGISNLQTNPATLENLLPAPFQLCLPLTPYWHTHSPSTGPGMWAGEGEEPESE